MTESTLRRTKAEAYSVTPALPPIILRFEPATMTLFGPTYAPVPMRIFGRGFDPDHAFLHFQKESGVWVDDDTPISMESIAYIGPTEWHVNLLLELSNFGTFEYKAKLFDELTEFTSELSVGQLTVEIKP